MIGQRIAQRLAKSEFMARKPALVILILAVLSACETAGLDIVFYQGANGYRFSSSERRAIERIATNTIAEVRRLLPGLAARLTLRVRPGKGVIPETGESGEASAPAAIYWTIDPEHPRGIREIAELQLRPTLFHECHHLVRGAALGLSSALRDVVIAEGLATVFERDAAGASPLWGAYPPEVAVWAREVLALRSDASRDEWMRRHPDGRRWVGYKVGTYLVDLAVAVTRRSAADLVTAPAEEIIDAALANAAGNH
jgi:hypothetical protein